MAKVTRKKETVLYYNPGSADRARLMKGVLVRMGIRIRNIAPDQVLQQVGYLAGLPDYTETELTEGETLPEIPEEVLVLQGFGNRRLDELLTQLRRVKAPNIELKAVVTEHNSSWSFYQLYEELRQEREKILEAEAERKAEAEQDNAE